MTISMTPLLRGAGKTGQEPAAAGAAADTPRFAEQLSRQTGSGAGVLAGPRDDTPSASGEAGDHTVLFESTDKPESPRDDSGPVDTELEPAEAAGRADVAPALPSVQPGHGGSTPIGAGKAFETAAGSGDNGTGRLAEGQAGTHEGADQAEEAGGDKLASAISATEGNPPRTARATATPEWLAQIEHGQRWQQNTEEAGGKPLPPAVEPEGASGEMAQMPAEPDAAAGKPLAEALFSGRNPAPDQGEGAAPLVPEPASALAPSRDGVQGTTPQPERPVTLERALTLQGGPEHGARQLAQQVQVMVSQNLQEADIRLSPSELGGVRIQLKMEQGEVNIQFLASQPQARELLEQALPRLRDMLVQQGITLGQGQVGGFPQQPGSQQQTGGDARHPGGTGQTGERGEPGEEEAQDWQHRDLWLEGAASGRIDFFA